MSAATLLAVAGSMGVSDVLSTLCVIAEADRRALRAGICDALGDLARITYIILGVDAVLKQGFARAVPVLAVICLASLVSTTLTVKYAPSKEEA